MTEEIKMHDRWPAGHRYAKPNRALRDWALLLTFLAAAGAFVAYVVFVAVA